MGKPIDKPCVCKYCHKKFLSADVKTNYCSACRATERLCACGCGGIVVGMLYDYLFGHANRGSHRSEVVKKRMRLAFARRSARPEYRRKLSRAIRRSYKESGRLMKGKNNPNWKGGRWQVCSRDGCAEKFYSFAYSRRAGHGNYCSIACSIMDAVKRRYKHIRYKKVWMRSLWEVAFAKWLDKHTVKWQYEPESFFVEPRRYIPDFYLPDFDLYVEVKGWLRKESFRKMVKFVGIYGKSLCLLQERGLKSLGVLHVA